MNGANRIKLISLEINESGGKISFASFLKQDYVAKSLVIYLDGGNIIERIFFSSDIFGTVEWQNGSGLINSHRWENEEQAQAPTYLTRRYTSILSDGAADVDYARNSIVPDVLDNLADADTAEWIGDIVMVKEYLVPVDLSRYGN
ncbi:MAG: hypothetical protein E4G96_01840 [Chrysiogenales bacterium]|nr:MAG: hypothetical protein E4G96_01840 [Chrysiogenales bacterium]